ncbi:MAG: Ycf66 family protein [Synechococcus sp. WH 8007]|nr:Ycf66 family protein [Synechococcus sp. WH 8007]
MLATLGGTLALLVGLTVMLLPLLATELSRPRDAAWGAVVLLLGLTLVTSADRLTGSPMLAVLCGGLLIARLGSEVLQSRWRMLTPEEQQRIASLERWQTSLGELFSSSSKAAAVLNETGGSLLSAFKGGPKPGKTRKRWVRSETESASNDSASTDAKTTAEVPSTTPEEPAPEAPALSDVDLTVETSTEPITEPTVVASFDEVEELLEASSPQAG